jgi:hypothetical protein
LEDCDPGWTGQKARPYLKNNRAKRTGGVAKAVECLPQKNEDLSSNSSTTTRKGGQGKRYLRKQVIWSLDL